MGWTEPSAERKVFRPAPISGTPSSISRVKMPILLATSLLGLTIKVNITIVKHLLIFTFDKLYLPYNGLLLEHRDSLM